jgi:phosphopantothenoylcysteine synthetase/decarboxylase
MMRALTPDTPVIICPAMNTHMYQHPFTADHLKTVQERLGYMISGPQGAGILACGDEGESLALSPSILQRQTLRWTELTSEGLAR